MSPDGVRNQRAACVRECPVTYYYSLDLRTNRCGGGGEHRDNLLTIMADFSIFVSVFMFSGMPC